MAKNVYKLCWCHSSLKEVLPKRQGLLLPSFSNQQNLQSKHRKHLTARTDYQFLHWCLMQHIYSLDRVTQVLCLSCQMSPAVWQGQVWCHVHPPSRDPEERKDFATFKWKITRLPNSSSSHSLFSYLPLLFLFLPYMNCPCVFQAPSHFSIFWQNLWFFLVHFCTITAVFVIAPFSAFFQSQDMRSAFRLSPCLVPKCALYQTWLQSQSRLLQPICCHFYSPFPVLQEISYPCNDGHVHPTQTSFHVRFQETLCQMSSHLTSWRSVICKGPFSNKMKKNLQQYKYICKMTSHLYCNSCWGNTGFPWLKITEVFPSGGKQFLKKLCILLCFTALTPMQWTGPGTFLLFGWLVGFNFCACHE